jgi:two-component system sensor histidine kinase KdpD
MKMLLSRPRLQEAAPARPEVVYGVALQVIFGAASVALVTAVCFSVHVNYLIPSFLYLLILVFLSLSAGFAAAAVVSLMAVVCLDFFFVPPVLTWQINNPKDAFALLAYLVTSFVITRLASSARAHAQIAEDKQRDIARLYDTASRLLSLDPEVAAGPRALQIFREGFDLSAACLFDATTSILQIDGVASHGLVEATREASVAGQDYRSPDGWVHVHCLFVEGKPAGAAGFEGRFVDDAAVKPLFALAATAFERALSFRNATKSAAAAQAEMLRSAIVDAFAHEFKTPQAVIMAAAGSLRETGGLSHEQLEMADVIESEIWRLNRLTNRLLRMARIDRDEVKPNMELTSLDRLVAHLVRQYRGQSRGHQISLRHWRNGPDVLADPELMNLAFVQLLDNACKYSTPDSSITVEMEHGDDFADIFVTNDGGFIREEERERVFERFYRGAETEHSASGAGLGLYVARKIARAHGGDLDLCRNHTETGTTTFRLRIPIVRRGALLELKAS